MTEVSSSTVTFPKHLELLVVLDKQAVDYDVVAIHHESIGARIAGPAHSFAVVRTPYPGVVDDDFVAVDAQVGLRAARTGSTHAEKASCKVIGFCAWRALLPSGPTSNNTGEFFGPASKRRPAISIPSTSAVTMAAVP